MIAGPTASGKTALGIAEALASNGEVISADSRQVFRGMEIGTAAPSEAERAGVPHHLIGMRDPGEGAYSAGAFVRDAEAHIDEIRRRGNTPIVVGGTGFYLNALLFGLSDLPEVDPDVRQILNRELAQTGLAPLVAELADVDPAAHARLDLSNPARVLRALEVARSTGRPLTDWQTGRREPRHRYRLRVLLPDPATHRAAIEHRAARMLEGGWIDEVRALRAALPHDHPLLGTIGYRELGDWLAHLAPGLEDDPAPPLALLDAIATRTWQYARRQRTYFRSFVSNCNNGSIPVEIRT